MSADARKTLRPGEPDARYCDAFNPCEDCDCVFADTDEAAPQPSGEDDRE